MRRWVPIADAAAYAGFADTDRLRRLAKEGRIRSVEPGILLDLDDLNRHLQNAKKGRPRGGDMPCQTVPIGPARIYRGR